jgi:hypothetical protein
MTPPTAAWILFALLLLAGIPSLIAAVHLTATSKERPLKRMRLASRFLLGPAAVVDAWRYLSRRRR